MSKMHMLLLAGSVVAFGTMAGCTKEAEVEGTTPESTNSTTTGSSTPSTTTDGTTGSTTSDVAPVEAPTSAPEQKVTVKDGEEVGVIETGKGQIIVKFYPEKAPNHVKQFKMLATEKFWDGTRFHRCIDGFMIQGGDPNTKDLSKAGAWGTGGYTKGGKEVNVKAEFNDISHKRGILSAARSQDPDSASSQFFLMHKDSTFLDGQYSAYGEIVKGIEVVDIIVKTGDPNNNGAVAPADAVLIKSIRIAKWPVK